MAGTWLIPKSERLFLGPNFCHTTSILVNDPFVALGVTVHFPPGTRSCKNCFVLKHFDKMNGTFLLLICHYPRTTTCLVNIIIKWKDDHCDPSQQLQSCHCFKMYQKFALLITHHPTPRIFALFSHLNRSRGNCCPPLRWFSFHTSQ